MQISALVDKVVIMADKVVITGQPHTEALGIAQGVPHHWGWDASH